MLDDFEWANRQNSDALTIDVSRLRQELGIAES